MNFNKIRYIERNTKEIKTEFPPGEKFLKYLYYHPLGKLTTNMIVKRKILSSIYGKRMSKLNSTKLIKPFVIKNKINMDESIKSIDEFDSFNDFFIRKLKDDARKIDRDENVIVSPSDGKILVFNDLNKINKFFMKGNEFSLNEFFKDNKLSEKFENGTMIIIRLAPVDYHRFHFPTAGKITASKRIEGYYYSVSPYAIKQNFKIYCENKREVSILKTNKFGDIALCEIGATMVGGIKQTYKSNSYVDKGEEKGYFYFGGSSIIMFFQKNKIKIDEDILNNSKNGMETKIDMGERIAISSLEV